MLDSITVDRNHAGSASDEALLLFFYWELVWFERSDEEVKPAAWKARAWSRNSTTSSNAPHRGRRTSRRHPARHRAAALELFPGELAGTHRLSPGSQRPGHDPAARGRPAAAGADSRCTTPPAPTTATRRTAGSTGPVAASM
ncbi:hypothetical protein ACPA9J_31480 [Pseudomonas aeruginosa]